MDEDKQTGKARIAARRSFLATAALVPTLAAAAALLARKSGNNVLPPALSDDAAGAKGYHETEHIRKYYSTAAF